MHQKAHNCNFAAIVIATSISFILSLLRTIVMLAVAPAFNVHTHVTPHIQRVVGLQLINCKVPWIGNHTWEGEQGYDSISSTAHMQPLSTKNALRIYNLILNAAKHQPVNAEDALAISLLAQNAGQGTPAGCSALIAGGDAPTEPVTIYWTAGNCILSRRTFGSRFISFVYLNMDGDSRVKWYDLIGHKQNEWIDCWISLGHPFLCNEAATHSLRGTDLTQIADAVGLEAAMAHSPSLVCRRPDQHTIQLDIWAGIAQNLFGA